MAFILIGALGFIWMGFWVFMYKAGCSSKGEQGRTGLIYSRMMWWKQYACCTKKITSRQAFRYRQTWAFAAKASLWLMVYGGSFFSGHLPILVHIRARLTQSAPQVFVLYLITLLSIIGDGFPPISFPKGMNPYAGRMKAMLIFAFFPLLTLFAQPLGHISVWIPVVIIGIAGAAHQSWSANIFSTVSDMFQNSYCNNNRIGGMAGRYRLFPDQ